MSFVLRAALFCALMPMTATAQQGSLFVHAPASAPLIAAKPAAFIATEAAPLVGGAGRASLFAGQSGTSFFAPLPDRPRSIRLPVAPGPYASDADRIRHVIASAEASKHGYDSVQHGARRKPARAPTQMTLGEIYDWIAATPGQPHAIGRYQFIPKTLKRLAKRAGMGRNTPFSPQTQDQLADILLEEAGLSAIRAGKMSRRDFMNNLAKIWAGLPNSSGRSHYHGYAGNKASISWAKFETEMKKIFPS
ncbi:hypothetical protein [Tropicibacter naphthalenivorans]|uniref:Muramidase (Phage lambda lysozyme) n=1 Tax=Tropicibacter naphthalenivorans TaxID=441103 RepID=A0A0N7LYL9_9RHOB|nr:hypothetical protein [Tropicibacter naphthalenivorans]CUH75233.1 hypothetical protein TRN7648_00334 [Tropicibacter naphthalenivorans]SMC45441.1 hypothetical protein SAMN04488093_101546 [Tropicibacter naphthalenivorans]